MNYAILTLLILGLEVDAYAQGAIALDNISNASSSPSPFATTAGLFWIATGGSTILITNDFNAAFYAGTDTASLSPLATFLLSNDTAAGDNAAGPGTFADPHGNDYTILGTGANPSAFFQIQAWTGNFNSYAAAVAAGAPAAQSPVFVNPVSIPPGPAPSLYDMPAMVLSSVPEPSTVALAGLGALGLLLFRKFDAKAIPIHLGRACHTGMQWLKLQISSDNSSLILADHGRIYDTNTNTDNPWWYYFPSLTVNCAGDMVAGFSGSTATNYVSTFYTWRLSSGATLMPPGLIQAGMSITSSKLGDYSATTLDPADDWSFWTVQEYAGRFGGFNRWGTVVSRIKPTP